LYRACCFNYFFNIPTHVHTIYILTSTKIRNKTLKNLPLYVSVPFLRPSSGGPWTVLCQVTKLRLGNLVTTQSTVHGPPEDGLKM